MLNKEGLKPCPFCGTTNVTISPSDNEIDIEIKCPECDAMMVRFKNRRRELIEAWNRRIGEK